MMNEMMSIVALLLWVLGGVVLAKRKPLFDEPNENETGGHISWLKIPVGESIEFELSAVVFSTVANVRDVLGFNVPPQAKDDARAAVIHLGQGHGLKFGEWEVGGEFLTLSPGLVNDLLLTVYGKHGKPWAFHVDHDEYDHYTPPGKVSQRFKIQHVDDSGSRSYYEGRII